MLTYERMEIQRKLHANHVFIQDSAPLPPAIAAGAAARSTVRTGTGEEFIVPQPGM
jgi:hypothetical protein